MPLGRSRQHAEYCSRFWNNSYSAFMWFRGLAKKSSGHEFEVQSRIGRCFLKKPRPRTVEAGKAEIDVEGQFSIGAL